MANGRPNMPSRVVLLTGAAGGIGRIMTNALLADGHRVVAVDRSAALLGRLKTACNAGDKLYPVLAQLHTDRGCAAAVAAACDRFGTVDALINNAGIGMSAIR